MYKILNTIQDDHRGFRRQLEEKRPVIDSNLRSGRQYINNESQIVSAVKNEGKTNNINNITRVIQYNINYRINTFHLPCG